MRYESAASKVSNRSGIRRTEKSFAGKISVVRETQTLRRTKMMSVVTGERESGLNNRGESNATSV